MALIDDVLSTINGTLLANLSWLDNSYGKIQRIRKKDKASGKERVFPGVYVGGSTDDYISVLPDEILGNYSFFEVKDPAQYENNNRILTVSFEFKLCFWFHWPDLYADYRSRSIEEVKAQVLNVLTASQFTRSLSVFNVWEDADYIFQNFTNQGYITAYDHKQLKSQFLMKPFGGLAISGAIKSMPTCFPAFAMPTIPPYIFGMFPANYSLTEQIYPLETWFGEQIWWRTWNLGNGDGTNKAISGITESDINQHVKAELRGVNAITGDPIHIDDAQIAKNGASYEVFIPDFMNNAYLTWYYVK